MLKASQFGLCGCQVRVCKRAEVIYFSTTAGPLPAHRVAKPGAVPNAVKLSVLLATSLKTVIPAQAGIQGTVESQTWLGFPPARE
jgi:hypothetical protein